MISPHQACLDQLNHYLTLALVCGARMPQSEDKQILQSFGLIHFLIISGAHVQFVINFFNFIDMLFKKRFDQYIVLPKLIHVFKITSLPLLAVVTAFSAPVLRASLYILIDLAFKKNRHRSLSRGFKSILILFLLLPFAVYSNQTLSLILSLSFSLICGLSFSKNKLKSSFLIYILSTPLFLSLFTIPSYLSVFLNPLFSFFIALIFLPLSFLSLFSDHIELLNVQLWWANLDLMFSIKTFFNIQDQTTAHKIFKPYFCYAYLFLLILIEIFLRPLWIRNSYSLS